MLTIQAENPMHDTTESHPNYLTIFFCLCGLTLASVVLDLFSSPTWKVTIGSLVMLVAAAKAGLVMLFFMHLKYERNWKYALLMPTVILSMGMILAFLPDISLHYYPLDVPQVSEVIGESSH